MTERDRRYYGMGYKAALRVRRERFRVAHPKYRDERKLRLAQEFGLSKKQIDRILESFLDQLDRCADDDARKVLLGVQS